MLLLVYYGVFVFIKVTLFNVHGINVFWKSKETGTKCCSHTKALLRAKYSSLIGTVQNTKTVVGTVYMRATAGYQVGQENK